MRFIHYDDAKREAISRLKNFVKHQSAIKQALFVADLFGKLRLVLWTREEHVNAPLSELTRELAEKCGGWWTKEVLFVEGPGDAAQNLWGEAWKEAWPDPDEQRMRVLDRHRSRTAWFLDVAEPLWAAPETGPPIVVFYAFKGGVGRSAALAAFAMQRAQAGEHITVVDFDLDAPGIGRLLASDEVGRISPWGVVDYLLERGHGEVPLSDYYHRCDRLAGRGRITVFPAGTLDQNYADKLSRVDFEEQPTDDRSPLFHLFQEIREKLNPDWILVDARTGISEPASHLLSGIAHLHVLFGTTSEQSWLGLRGVIGRLGAQQVRAERPQAEILLVQAMVPPTADSAERATQSFAERARQEFTEWYYAEEPKDPTEDTFWDVRDLDTTDAPHMPVALRYDPRLADFRDIAEVVDVLRKSTDYVHLTTRIADRFEKEPNT